jgi:hypothetical protein
MSSEDRYTILLCKDYFSLDQALQDLCDKVNNFLLNGWDIQGGVSISFTERGLVNIAQAMIRK